jgi:predicted HTH transcriptional regulator
MNKDKKLISPHNPAVHPHHSSQTNIMKESQKTEFKQIWKDEYLKHICAFANTHGGSLLIGVGDNGEIVGIKERKKEIT